MRTRCPGWQREAEARSVNYPLMQAFLMERPLRGFYTCMYRYSTLCSKWRDWQDSIYPSSSIMLENILHPRYMCMQISQDLPTASGFLVASYPYLLFRL